MALNFSAPFIARPIGTALMAIGVALAGIVAYFDLPVAPLPKVDFPTIAVTAQQPGADPAIMAASVAAPLERRIGEIPEITGLWGAARYSAGPGPPFSRPSHSSALPSFRRTA